MSKYFINMNPTSEFYLQICSMRPDGSVYDELGNGAGWELSPNPEDFNPADLQEISGTQYHTILYALMDGGKPFQGDWSQYPDYIKGVIEGGILDNEVDEAHYG